MTLINLSTKESLAMPAFYCEFALPKWIKLGINTVRNVAEGRVGLRKFAREIVRNRPESRPHARPAKENQ